MTTDIEVSLYILILAVPLGLELVKLVSPLLHTWSLAIEEQFYLLAPWIARLLTRSQLPWFAAAKWMNTIPTKDILAFIEKIPYKETRAYYDTWTQFEARPFREGARKPERGMFRVPRSALEWRTRRGLHPQPSRRQRGALP